MPTPGYVFKDGGTTPEEKNQDQTLQGTAAVKQTDPTPPVQEHPAVKAGAPLSKNSSESHALAVAHHEVTGAAQAAGHLDEVPIHQPSKAS